MQPFQRWSLPIEGNRIVPSGGHTLKHNNIEWGYFDYEGHLALGYGKFAIHYEAKLKQFVLKESGKILLIDVSMSRLMDMASDIIFDFTAQSIKSIWENSYEQED